MVIKFIDTERNNMGGICGFIGIKNANDKTILKKMYQAISHRGHRSKFFVDKISSLCAASWNNEAGIYVNENEDVVTAFEGEILNYNELKNQYNSHHEFNSSNDGELITHLYEDHGIGCVKLLRGYFAFVIIDKSNGNSYLVRDRAGKSTLYYTFCRNDTLVFGSEIKSILQFPEVNRVVDKKAMNLFFLYNHVPIPYTLFKNIRKMPPAHIMKYSQNKNKSSIFFDEYWKVNYEPRYLDEDYWSKILYENLKDSIRSNITKAGDPIGIFLSGGLDSSILSSIASKIVKTPIKSFTIAYEEENFNEPYAKIVADYLGIEYNEITFRPKDLIKIFPRLVQIYDEPVPSPFITLPTYALFRNAFRKAENIFTGDGGALFWGFTIFYDWLNLTRFSTNIPRIIRRSIINLIDLQNIDLILGTPLIVLSSVMKASLLPENLRPLMIWRVFNEENIGKLVKFNSYKKGKILLPDSNYSSPADKLSRFKEDNLTRMYYANSLMSPTSGAGLTRLEYLSSNFSARLKVPYYDHKLVEVAATIPPSLKQPSRNEGKYIIRKMASKYKLLPKDVIKQSKRGLGDKAFDTWFIGELREYLVQMLLEETPSLLDKSYIKKLCKNAFAGKLYDKRSSRRLLAIITFNLWHKEYIENEKT